MKACLQRLCLAAAVLIAGPAFVSPAWADSWAMPAPSTYHSENGTFRLTIEPAPIGSQLEFFRGEIEAEESGSPVDRPAPLGLLEKRNGESWVPIWAKPLVNAVAPVNALVSDRGQVVTFDNWHSIGFGENVIVIYGVDGALVRSMALTDLLPEVYFAALPRSVSSLRWRDGARFDPGGELLELDVAFPSEKRGEEAPVRFQLSLANGGAWPVETDRLAIAMATAERIEQGRIEADTALIAYLKRPLAAPAEPGGPWQEYLLEAFLRLTPDYLDSPFPDITILFEPDNDRYRESVDWLVESFANLENLPAPSTAVVASPHSQEGLLKALDKASRSVTGGSLDGRVVYVSVDSTYRAEAERLVTITGAQFVWLDPASAIPQRPERVPGSAEEIAADEEIARRRRAEIDAMFEEISE